MDIFYSIGEAASMANTTVETLRHYDRINLLKPAKVDPLSKYRYYTEKELLYLCVIDFCKQRNMSLTNIKEIFHNGNFEQIVDFLKMKELEIDDEIDRLVSTKEKIRSLNHIYKEKLC